VAAAPVPDAGAGANKTKVAPSTAAFIREPETNIANVLERAAILAERVQVVFLPDLQPLLCTFLI
jgi:hypothetical protein